MDLAELVELRVAQLRDRGFLVPSLTSSRRVGTRAGWRNSCRASCSWTRASPTTSRQVSANAPSLPACSPIGARLNAHVIPRGIDDDAIAQRLNRPRGSTGDRPPPRNPRRAQRRGGRTGDEIVSPAWFRQQGVRVLTAPGEALDAPALVARLRSQETCRSTRRASPGLSAKRPARCRPSTIRTGSSRSLRNTCRSRCEPTGRHIRG